MFFALIFRFPSENELKIKWTDAIEKATNSRIMCGYICNLHFQPNEMKHLSDRVNLKIGTIPSVFVFEQANHENVYENTFNLNTEENNIECKQLELEIGQLRASIIKINLDNNVRREKYENQISKLKNENSKQAKELSSLKGKVSRLQKKVDFLKEKTVDSYSSSGNIEVSIFDDYNILYPSLILIENTFSNIYCCKVNIVLIDFNYSELYNIIWRQRHEDL